ncbi:MAG: uncharacterized protein A8A55_1069 [Amphiamblys sp. WSBS2006]|nr:MAG: uncharacterized protein A8A55_1069 [Amphiamblys sp. WSBS2006]
MARLADEKDFVGDIAEEEKRRASFVETDVGITVSGQKRSRQKEQARRMTMGEYFVGVNTGKGIESRRVSSGYLPEKGKEKEKREKAKARFIKTLGRVKENAMGKKVPGYLFTTLLCDAGELGSILSGEAPLVWEFLKKGEKRINIADAVKKKGERVSFSSGEEREVQAEEAGVITTKEKEYLREGLNKYGEDFPMILYMYPFSDGVTEAMLMGHHGKAKRRQS